MKTAYRAVMPFGKYVVGDDVPEDVAAEHPEKTVRVIVPDTPPAPGASKD